MDLLVRLAWRGTAMRHQHQVNVISTSVNKKEGLGNVFIRTRTRVYVCTDHRFFA